MNSINSWNNNPTSIAFLKGHFGIASYLLKLPNINAEYVDDNGRTLSMQLIMNISNDTAEQLKFLGDNTNISFKERDK